MDTWYDTVHSLPDETILIVRDVLGVVRRPDLTIAPFGKPYLYRWHLMRSTYANAYLHLQVASDPERPLHDHPWDNQSVILAGGYWEALSQYEREAAGEWFRVFRKAGDVIHRKAAEPHRLVLDKEGPHYALTMFTSGPKIREWGFWYPEGWVHNYDVVRTENGVSTQERI